MFVLFQFIKFRFTFISLCDHFFSLKVKKPKIITTNKKGNKINKDKFKLLIKKFKSIPKNWRIWNCYAISFEMMLYFFIAILKPDKYLIELTYLSPINNSHFNQCKVKAQNWKVIKVYKPAIDFENNPKNSNNHPAIGANAEAYELNNDIDKSSSLTK